MDNQLKTVGKNFYINVWSGFSRNDFLNKGIVHQFWICNIFLSQQKKHLLKKVHLDITTLTQNNWENVSFVKARKKCYLFKIGEQSL